MRKIFTLTCLLVTVSAVFSQEKVLDSAYLQCLYGYTWENATLKVQSK